MGEIGHIGQQSRTGDPSQHPSDELARRSLEKLLNRQPALVLATVGAPAAAPPMEIDAPRSAARDLPRAYATPLFFAWLPPDAQTQQRGPACPPPQLCFYSSLDSCHARHIGDRAVQVAVGIHNQAANAEAIANPNFDVATIHGAQLIANCRRLDPDAPQAEAAVRAYITRFPFAAAHLERPGHALFILTLLSAKITDNTWGLGRHAELNFAPERQSSR